MEGWIKLYRKFKEWEWYHISEMVHLFVHILINANHKDGSWQGMEVKRGQLITGINSLHKATGLSIQTIRTCLKRLEKTGEINRLSNNHYSIITICNYDYYNDADDFTNKQPNEQTTSDQQATNKQLTTNKNVKNVNNVKNNRGVFLKPTIEEIKKYCIDRKNKVDALAFFNFYESKGWMIGKNKMKDWKAAIHTWETKQSTSQVEVVKSKSTYIPLEKYHN